MTMEAIDQIPLSPLQHWHYCPRQCGLIHLEQVFDESIYTLRGQAVHGVTQLRVLPQPPFW